MHSEFVWAWGRTCIEHIVGVRVRDENTDTLILTFMLQMFVYSMFLVKLLGEWHLASACYTFVPMSRFCVMSMSFAVSHTVLPMSMSDVAVVQMVWTCLHICKSCLFLSCPQCPDISGCIGFGSMSCFSFAYVHKLMVLVRLHCRGKCMLLQGCHGTTHTP